MNTRIQQTEQELREQLSALMDGELPRDQALFLLKRLERDEALRQEWERLHRIRDGFNAVEQRATSDFSSRVMAAIAAEAVATGQPALRARTAGMPRWLQTMAGGAVAAGVAWVALVSTAPPIAQPSLSAVASSNAASGDVVLTNPGSAATGAMLLPQQVFSQASQTSGGTPMTVNPATLTLDRYLLRHGQALQYTGSQQPIAPYMYAVSFGDNAARAQQAR
jgi:sigma-E factor negative regulatory protein RseA